MTAVTLCCGSLIISLKLIFTEEAWESSSAIILSDFGDWKKKRVYSLMGKKHFSEIIIQPSKGIGLMSALTFHRTFSEFPVNNFTEINTAGNTGECMSELCNFFEKKLFKYLVVWIKCCIFASRKEQVTNI